MCLFKPKDGDAETRQVSEEALYVVFSQFAPTEDDAGQAAKREVAMRFLALMASLANGHKLDSDNLILRLKLRLEPLAAEAVRTFMMVSTICPVRL